MSSSFQTWFQNKRSRCKRSRCSSDSNPQISPSTSSQKYQVNQHKQESHDNDTDLLSTPQNDSSSTAKRVQSVEEIGIEKVVSDSNLSALEKTLDEQAGNPSLHATIKSYPRPPHYSDLMSAYTPLPIPAITPHDYVYIPIINPYDGGCYYQPVPRDRVLPFPEQSHPCYYLPSIPRMSTPRVISPPDLFSARTFLPESSQTPSIASKSLEITHNENSIHVSPSSGYSSRNTDSDVFFQ